MSKRYVEIDLKRVAENQFSAEELAAMASDDEAVQDVDWTSSVMEALEETHWFETLLMEYIKENYKQ